MPTYQYKCPSCGYTEDQTHLMQAQPMVRCPMDHQQMFKVLFPVASHFKGRGWAADNYAK